MSISLTPSSAIPTFLLILLLSSAIADTIPKKIGNGYRLISIQKSSNGGLVGLLQLKQKSNIYGADIPKLKLSVK